MPVWFCHNNFCTSISIYHFNCPLDMMNVTCIKSVGHFSAYQLRQKKYPKTLKPETANISFLCPLFSLLLLFATKSKNKKLPHWFTPSIVVAQNTHGNFLVESQHQIRSWPMKKQSMLGKNPERELEDSQPEHIQLVSDGLKQNSLLH